MKMIQIQSLGSQTDQFENAVTGFSQTDGFWQKAIIYDHA